MDPTHCVKLANSWFNSVPRNFWWCQAVSHFGGRIFRRLHLKTRCVTAARLGRPIPSNAAQDMALLSRAMKDPMVGQLYRKKCSGHTERSSSWRHLNVSSSTAEWSLRCSSLKLCNCDKVVFFYFSGNWALPPVHCILRKLDSRILWTLRKPLFASNNNLTSKTFIYYLNPFWLFPGLGLESFSVATDFWNPLYM